MACSICQSMTFQATAGSRLEGSLRYASDIVPPCTGVSDDDGLWLPDEPPPDEPPQAASAKVRSRVKASAGARTFLLRVLRGDMGASCRCWCLIGASALPLIGVAGAGRTRPADRRRQG